ncbi:hypothetical protein DOTSEDRAFT_74542 [Dothistroma septosporum NZE10]|uniref:histidine kinase n=1 Tax=Dothistroma septosporum (strain NZE10 / CBS 128990) TaxID=675120 RepID=N1PHL0_DOTSN|nr:hypothetical protein DOTSEDRAFT_74542 [Dothistroma septosporum NZE10]
MDDETDPNDIPEQLRALVDFLDEDHRPSLVLQPPSTKHNASWNVLWYNQAFRSQARPDDERRDALQAVESTLAARRHVSALHGRALEGKRWQARITGGYCITLAIETRSQLGAPENDSTTQRTQRHANVQTVASDGQNGQQDCRRYLDWTQNAIPNMSPWIEFLRDVDWASTGVGPMHSWPIGLRHYVLSITSNPNPRLLVWGDDMVFIYNEACVQLFGKKHPVAMGQHTSQAFAEAWPTIKPLIEHALTGAVSPVKHAPMYIERKGFLEETYWDFTLLPILNDEGYCIGVLDEITETTGIVTGERRRMAIADLTVAMESTSSVRDIWPAVTKSLDAATLDVPFALLYAIVDDLPEGGDSKSESTLTNSSSSTMRPKKCVLAGTTGIKQDHPDAIDSFALLENFETEQGLVKFCSQAWNTSQAIELSSREGSLPPGLATVVPGRGFDDKIETALLSPIRATTGNDMLGILITGLNPRTEYEGEYKFWMTVSTSLIEKAAALISLPEEQRRAQKIANDMNNALAQQLRLTTIQAEKSEAKFQRLAETAPTGMFMFDGQGHVLYINDTYAEIFGETRESLTTRTPEEHHWNESIHEDDLERLLESWSEIKEKKTPIAIEYRLKKPWTSIDKLTGQELSGETWLMATGFPEIDADGSVATVQGWLTDISHRKFSENLLAQRLEDALENKRSTENFIDMTSHEMRNPLSAILQSADSIASMLAPAMPILDEEMAIPSNTAEEIVDAAQTIILCAQHQKRIVDDILTLSKLDASLLVISPDKVQAPTLITKALKMYEAEIERAEIDAQLCIEPTYDKLEINWVLLDPSRLLQVVINLLTNSIKFTQHGQVRKVKICLGASYQRPTGKHHGISFVPPRVSRPARSPFINTDGADDIYLQIAVYDTGRGLSEDEMKLLFQRFQQASPKTYKQYGGSGLGLFISRELCELQGGQIGVSSGDGKTCFTFFVKAKRWTPESELQPAKANFDNKFTSNAASPMAYSRRGSTVLGAPTNQLGITSHDAGPERGYINPMPATKPSTSKPTIEVAEQPAAEDLKATPKQMHVLIVEDNQINQKVMSQQLKRAGCVVHVANHGLECLEFLEKSTFCAAETPLSLILLDLEMPIMDGLTAIRHIRKRQSTGQIDGHIPVIAVTANARSEQISQAIDAGMDQVVTKPFRIPELVPQMEALVQELAQANGT